MEIHSSKSFEMPLLLRLTIKDPMMKTLKMIAVTMKEMMKNPPTIPLLLGS